MIRSGERPAKSYKYGRVGVLVAGLMLSSCSIFGTADDTPQTTGKEKLPSLPTAKQLAGHEGGSVSQLPVYEEGYDGIVRYCREIGGKLIKLSATEEDAAAWCQAGDVEIKIGPAEADESFLRLVCTVAGGQVKYVAAEEGGFVNVPACHTGAESK